MKKLVLTLVCLGAAVSAHAGSCTQIGNQVVCDNGTTAQQIGGQTFYNYPDPSRARQQGLPSSSTRIGGQTFYDNGVTATDIGNQRTFSNGVTRQSIGNTDFYSNGKTCQTIGNQRFCN